MSNDTGGWIRTFTGRSFYPLDPRLDDLDIKDIGHALARQCRFAGHTCRFYSVAEHSVLVSKLMRPLGPKAELAGLMHDATEAYLGDICQPIKVLPAFDAYRKAEQQLDDLIRKRWQIPHDFDKQVGQADLIALATEARDLMGNPQDWSTLKGVKPDVDTIRGLDSASAEVEFGQLFIELMHLLG